MCEWLHGERLSSVIRADGPVVNQAANPSQSHGSGDSDASPVV